jgi:hypothetical protein
VLLHETPISSLLSTPIHLEFPAKHLILAINTLHSHPLPSTLSLTDINLLLDLAAFLQSDTLFKLITEHCLALVRSHPWRTFVIASKLEHVHLARLCLDNMSFDVEFVWRLDTKGWTTEMIRGIPISYLSELGRTMAMFPPRRMDKVGGSGERWHNISKAFDPVLGAACKG